MKRVLLLILFTGCSSNVPPPASSTTTPDKPPSAVVITPKNVVFTEGPLAASPTLQTLALPPVHGGCALWGATGRDHRGHIYLGVSLDGVDLPSAQLLEYNPASDEFAKCGDALQQLQNLNLAKPGEGQNKIHTKILQAADGLLYFASMDESGENEDGSKLPTFGSHLWRLKPGERSWQHLGHVPEAILASAVSGKFVYFLGYYGHVLYQFDTTLNKITNQVRVGSVGGHTTRNFLADDRGHVFVPRVTKDGASLVEFDEDLHEVNSVPLADYSTTPDASSHGIVGVTPLKGGSWCFVTDRGRLYRLDPRATGTTVTDLGHLHPQGESYSAALFCPDGETKLLAVGHRQPKGEPSYECIQFDLTTKTATATPLTMPIPGEHRAVLVYGSFTRDDAGRCYLVGRYLSGMQSVPAVWGLMP
ncbi:hypothetical protein BH11PLA2_BH11PLA2_21480 [soil metagenome]